MSEFLRAHFFERTLLRGGLADFRDRPIRLSLWRRSSVTKTCDYVYDSESLLNTKHLRHWNLILRRRNAVHPAFTTQ